LSHTETPLLTCKQKNTFSPKNEPTTMKLFWVEDAALKACAQLPDLNLNEVLVLEQYGKTFSMANNVFPSFTAFHGCQSNCRSCCHIDEYSEKENIPVTSFPAVRRLQHLNKEHVEPITHMVYAITW
jgi:hypothetical protein